MRTQESGAPGLASDIAGEATREGVKTDLQTNDGTAAGGDTVEPDAPPGKTMPPLAGVELPGPTYDLDDQSGSPGE